MDKQILQTVVETPEFINKSEAFMDQQSKDDFISYIASNPAQGDIITGTGGVRKIRWGNKNQGKRSGARIIYYYYNERLPLFLFTAYAKNQKVNLTATEKKTLANIVKAIVETYGDK